MPHNNPKDAESSSVDSLSFEASLKELEEVVRKLESVETSLEEAIALYERGAALQNRCALFLNKARLKIEQIVHKEGEALGLTSSELSKILPTEPSDL